MPRFPPDYAEPTGGFKYLWSKFPPLPLLEDDQREMPTTSYTTEEAFWHSHACKRPCCYESPAAQELKNYRAWTLKLPFISASSPVPELPRLPVDLLQAYETEGRSTQDRRPQEYTEEQEWLPYDREHLAFLSRLAEQYQSVDSTASEDEYQDWTDDPSESLS